MKRSFSIGVLVLISALPSSLAVGQTLFDPGLQLTTVLSHSAGLSSPTGMAFLGSDPTNFFAIEKNTGKVKHFEGGSATTALDLAVSSESERGLLGIALHPNFGQVGQPNNNKVYLYYSRSTTSSDSSSGHWLENRLSRFTWNGSSLTGEQVLATFGKGTDGRTSGPNHNGGPIKFGPDGNLYGITGDLNRREIEQNTSSSHISSRVSAIYRLTDSGGIPADNIYRNSSNASFHRVYAYGVRNSFGIDFDPANGRLWDTENGPDAYDEINRVVRGFNSGWTDIMGPSSRSPNDVNDLVKIASKSVYSEPELSWKDPIGVTAINFLYGSNLGSAYDNKVLVGDVNFGNLYMLTLNGDRTGFALSGGLADKVADTATQRNQLRIGNGFGVTTSILRGPDDNTYVMNFSTGEIYRIDAAMGGSAIAVVPEPSTICLAIIGSCAIAVGIRNRRKTCGRSVDSRPRR